MGQSKAKYWVAVCYPCNMLPDWKESIDDLLQYPYAYCVHDKDRDSTGKVRDAHVHIMIAFNNTTTYNHALNVFRQLNLPDREAVPTCKQVLNVRRMYDYLIHDTEECRKKGKHLYKPSERFSGNNFDIGLFEQTSLEDKRRIRRELSLLILEKNFTTYFDFYFYVSANYDTAYEDVVTSYSGHFEKLTRGNYQKNQIIKSYEEKEAKKKALQESLTE